MVDGIVVRTTGSSYSVRADSGDILTCYVKGNFRIRGIRSTNPVAVGDRVQVEQQEDGTNWILDLYDRRNYIIRRATNLSKYSHIIAANVDMLALVASMNHPITNPIFIDRCLATAEAYRVPVCLLFNKVDLLSAVEWEQLLTMERLYEELGYPVYLLSANRLRMPDAPLEMYSTPLATLTSLQALFERKTILLSGNSGVGKSTLLNALAGETIAKTASISVAHDKGMHTTTFSEMYDIPNSGHIIDTPGIKGFGVLEMEREEVSHYFKEIFRYGQQCRFSNCTHTIEPGCAVLSAVEKGDIALSRYQSYLSVLEDADESKYR